MKITGTLKVKENPSHIELAAIIEQIASYIIRKNENGEVEYTPYFEKYGFVVSIMRNLLEGVIIDKDEDDLFEIYNNNEEIYDVVNEFLENSYIADFIDTNVSDIVAFKKELFVNDSTELNKRLMKSIDQEQAINALNIKLLKKQNSVLSQQLKANEFNEKVMEKMTPDEVAEMSRKFSSGEYNFDKIAEVVTDKYINSELHKQKIESVMGANQKKIVNFSPTEDDGK